MKTTLKRGIGRSGSPNGNGRAVLPPSVFTSVTRYQQPRRRRVWLRLVMRGLAWLVALAVVTASGVAGGFYLYGEHDIAQAIAPTRVSVKVAENRLNVALPNEPATALVIGYDRRRGERGNSFRSDTIMLVRADPRGKTLSTLSFPRDLLVDVRCPGRASFPARINEAYATCKEQGTLETVRALTGLPIHYLVTVNFRGFKQIVARLGGVWMDVDRRYLNTHTGPYGYAAIDLQPGYQRLNGSDALDFVRYRHTDDDIHRNARQQLFLEAFKESVTSAISATKILKIVKVITSNVEVGQQGGGGPSLSTLLRYGLLAYHLPDGHFAQARIEGLYNDPATFHLIAPDGAISTAVWNFAHPWVERVQDGSAPERKRLPKAPPARATTVLVLNGNGVPGAAATTSEEIGKRGYHTVTPPNGIEANAPHQDHPDSLVFFRRGDEVSQSAALKLAKLVGRAEVRTLPRGRMQYLSNDAMVVLVVGRSFGGLAPPGGTRTKHERPYVTTNPGVTAPLLRQVRRKVPFRLLLPHVLERSSSPDDEMPIRVYTIARHKAVRLVYETGTHDYWGVEMTDWDEAPILAEPNTLKRIHGRTYELHYSGKHIRLVVVRYAGASYWVVNTLLNTLSNETMLAIAQGLQRLPRH